MDLRQLSSEVGRIKETAEKLNGERGNDRAVKQSDLRAVASYGMKSPAASSGTLADDYAALREDIAKVYELLAKVSNLYGTADR